MHGGAQAHLMRCSDENYYVVKFQNNPQHRRVLVNEMLGTRLASRLGLPTAAVSVVEVLEELIRLTAELCIETPRTCIPCASGLRRCVAVRPEPRVHECHRDGVVRIVIVIPRRWNPFGELSQHALADLLFPPLQPWRTRCCDCWN